MMCILLPRNSVHDVCFSAGVGLTLCDDFVLSCTLIMSNSFKIYWFPMASQICVGVAALESYVASSFSGSVM